MLIADINSCRRLASIAKALGADLPDSLARPLAAYDAIQRRRVRRHTSQGLTALINSTEPVADDTIDGLIDRMAADYARGQISRQLSEEAETTCLQAFRTNLMGDGGDQLTERLRPAFNAACADLVRVMASIPPESSAAQAIENGGEAVAAWQLGGTLAARFDTFTRYAVLVGRDFDTVGMGTTFNHPMASTVAFFVTPDTNLDQAARAFTGNPTRYRAGSFHALVAEANSSLNLASPRIAQAACTDYSNRVAAAEAERYQLQDADEVNA